MENMEAFYKWDEQDIKIGAPQTSFQENSWDQNILELLRTNSIKNLHMPWQYLHHLVYKALETSTHENPYSFMMPNEFCQLTRKECMTWRLGHSNQQANLITGDGARGYSQQDSRFKSNQSAHQLFAFTKSIKREVSHYTILKYENYFEAFKRNLLVTTTTNDCEEVPDGTYKPEDTRDSHELFKRKSISCTVSSTR